MNKANECTCPSGDGSLVHPCPAHPAVEQVGGDERAAFEAAYQTEHAGFMGPLKLERREDGEYKSEHVGSAWRMWQARAALAQPSPAQTQPSPAPTLRAAIDVANDRFEVPVAKWGTDLVGEEERPEVVAYFDRNYPSTGDAFIWSNYEGSPYEPVMTVAQHDRIVGALRAENAKLEKELAMARDAALKGDDARHAAGGMEMEIQELRENVAKLKKELRSRWTYASTQSTNCAGCGEHKHTPLRVDWMGGYVCLTCIDEKLEELHGAQVQHGLPDDDTILQIFADNAEHSERGGEHGYCIVRKQHALKIARELLAATPGTEVPQAWLDVQAERRRQVEVEGYHVFRDSHYISYELSKAARAYIEVSWHALSGGLPCKQPESWPWMAGFKWSDGRTMLVKACALTLAEIERLDRAAAPGKEVGHE
ncbi:TPA: hypothetical protein N2A57_001741 [Pseudomonas aeruginosa]|nr:hypothetical protein [Pseudomonas aeruginosa]